MEAVLDIQNLTKKYNGIPVVNNVSLKIQPGEKVGLLGANGAGKSTMIRIVVGETPATEGDVHVKNHSVTKEPVESRQAIGYVPQDTNIFPHLTAQEYIEFIIGVYGLDKSQAQAYANRMLSFFHLDQEESKLLRDYSYGMTRKTQLTAALLPHPSLLILDEALNGMDIRSLDQAYSLVNDAVKKGSALVMVSHDLYLIEKFCERIVILKQGEKVIDQPLESGSQLDTLVRQHIPSLNQTAEAEHAV